VHGAPPHPRHWGWAVPPCSAAYVDDLCDKLQWSSVGAIGVNAAGVATPLYLTCSVVLTTPNILTSVLFFPVSGTSEYRKSLSFSSAMQKLVNLLTVNMYGVCGDMDLPVCIVR